MSPAEVRNSGTGAFQSSIMMSGISPIVAYLIGVPAIMIRSILFVGAIIGLTIGRADETPPAKAPQKRLCGLCRISCAHGADASYSTFFASVAGPSALPLSNAVFLN